MKDFEMLLRGNLVQLIISNWHYGFSPKDQKNAQGAIANILKDYEDFVSNLKDLVALKQWEDKSFLDTTLEI